MKYDGVREKIESAYRRGDSWVQAIWYDNSLVLYTVEVCNVRVQPKFRLFGGQEIVINNLPLQMCQKSRLRPFITFLPVIPATY